MTGFFDCHVCGLEVGDCGKPACKLAGAAGAVAYRQCVNPDCLAEEGERHQRDCTPDDAGNAAAAVLFALGMVFAAVFVIGLLVTA